MVVLGVLVAAFVLSLRATQPESTFELTGESIGAPDASPILVFGATGGTGIEVVKILRARGDRVTAFVRPSSDRGPLEGLGVDFVVGDAMSLDDVRKAFGGGEFRAVITTIGCLPCDPHPDYIANKHVIDVAAATNVRRLILITSLGAGDSKDATPFPSRLFLRQILPLKEQAEVHLRASGLDYTIIRPGGLPPETEETGRGLLTEDRKAFGFIGRPDLARLIVGALDDDRTIGKTFAAMDPRRNSPWDSGQ